MQRRSHDSNDRRPGESGRDPRNVASRNQPLAPRTAALAGSRRHLGPLNQPEERNPTPSRAASGSTRREASARSGVPRNPGRQHNGNRRQARRSGAMYLKRGLPINSTRRFNPLVLLAPLAIVGVVAGAWSALHANSAPQEPTLGSRAGAQLTEQLQRASMVVEAPRVAPTPKKKWKKGAVPHIYQTDPAWADEPYAGETIAISGCGPTCLSMVYVALTGDEEMDPVSMAAFSESNDHVQQGMTAWTLFTDGAAKLGITGTPIPASAQSVHDELDGGKPVVFNVKPGSAFTTTGHYIVATGLDDEGRVIVNDPNSYALSALTWDLDYLISHSSNMWSFELS